MLAAHIKTTFLFFWYLLCFIVVFLGRAIPESEPVRNKTGKWAKWYVSREVWALDKYPLWFQGLVYFLTPQHTGELFNTALNTHYMHTDDVFLGIVVNKTKVFTTKHLWSIEAFSEAESDMKYLRTLWEDRKAIFYHVPDVKLYHSWYLEGLHEAYIPRQTLNYFLVSLVVIILLTVLVVVLKRLVYRRLCAPFHQPCKTFR